MSEVTRGTINLSNIEPERRPALVLEQFKLLPEGGELVLILGRERLQVLERLQSEQAGKYEWSILEEGPEGSSVLLTRHAASDRRAVSPAACMEWDHDRLDSLLAAHGEALASGRMDEAAQRFREFSAGLRHHIRMEEEVLFPAFERRVHSGECGPTGVMRHEHRIIESLLDRMAAVLGWPIPGVAELESLRGDLLELLGEHNAKEEHIVYPLTDLHHPGPERQDLICRMQAV